eukprot:1158151-Pelagomonas_calceolata.AAC.2
MEAEKAPQKTGGALQGEIMGQGLSSSAWLQQKTVGSTQQGALRPSFSRLINIVAAFQLALYANLFPKVSLPTL